MRMIESVLLVEPAFHAKKKSAEEKKAVAADGVDPTLPERYVFSQNVLLVDDTDDIPATTTIMDIISNAIGAKGVSEPDTPRAVADPNAPARPRLRRGGRVQLDHGEPQRRQELHPVAKRA